MARWKDTKNVVFLYQCCGSQQTAAVVAVEIQKLFYLRMQGLRRFFLFSGFSTFFLDKIWEKQSGQWDNEDEDQERSVVNKSKMNLTCTLINADRCWYKRCAQIQRVVIQQCVSCLCRSLARLGRLGQLDIHRLFCPLPILTHLYPSFWAQGDAENAKENNSIKKLSEERYVSCNFIPRQFETIWQRTLNCLEISKTHRSKRFVRIFVSFLSDRPALASFFPISGPGV